ncbi:MAG: hypothetical protein ACREEP_15165 [Dongiaceae bacterium]
MEIALPSFRHRLPGTKPGLRSGTWQWWTFAGADGAFMARGVSGEFIYVNPAEDLVIVVTSAWADRWNDELANHTYAVFDAFARKLHELIGQNQYSPLDSGGVAITRNVVGDRERHASLPA